MGSFFVQDFFLVALGLQDFFLPMLGFFLVVALLLDFFLTILPCTLFFLAALPLPRRSDGLPLDNFHSQLKRKSKQSNRLWHMYRNCYSTQVTMNRLTFRHDYEKRIKRGSFTDIILYMY